jgi:hypothetical protein
MRASQRAADQRQGRKRQQIAVHHPLDGAEVSAKGSAQARQRDHRTELSMNAIEDASTHAARTTRRRGAGISRPNSRGQGSAFITPTPH